MKCEKCQDKGFTERNHGLLMVLCDCEAGKAKRVELTGEVINDNPSAEGTGLPDTSTRSPDTSEPKQPKKRKPRKKATKKSS